MANWTQNDGENAGFADILRNFSSMLQDGRHIFDAATNALVGGTDPETIREDLFSTDERINQTEQRIRRQIVVHGTVHGAQTFPSLLIMMSLAKDAERIGDYCKNIFDLAVLGADLGSQEDRAALIQRKDRVSEVLGRARDMFDAQDEDRARALLADCDEIENECDDALERALREGGPGAAGFALANRYLKRVASHTANVATSLVMPLDKLDFFDEP